MKCPSCGKRTPDSLAQCAHCDAPTSGGRSEQNNFFGLNDSSTKSKPSMQQSFSPSSTKNGGLQIQVSGKTMLVVLVFAALPFLAFFVLVPMYHESQGRVAHYEVMWCTDTRNALATSASDIRAQGYQPIQRMAPGYTSLGREDTRHVQCFSKDAGQQEPSISSKDSSHEYRQVSTSYRDPEPDPQPAF